MTEAKEAQNVGADGMWPLPVVIAAGGKGTGDAFPLGLLGTALVAAGAATAAYERRRAENDGNRADR